jgi:hypothetical protein
MSYPCPKGHESTHPIWCSECSTRIPAADPLEGPSLHMTRSGEICPTPGCDTPRDGRRRFCENCRYDFELGKPYTGDGAFQPAPPPPQDFAPNPAVYSRPPDPPPDPERWEVVISIDPSEWAQDDAEPAPLGEPERVFPLDLPEHLIGRRSSDPNLRPTIIPDDRDHGVSRRHALLVRLTDGTYAIKELGSTNGTKLNGRHLPPGVLTPLIEGDSLSLPFWTRVTLRRQY